MPHGISRLFFCLSAAALLAGCLNPMTTRLPMLAPSDPRAEKRSFERFDPFPHQDAGPETSARPRGFIEQRSDVRSMRENSMLRGLNREQVPETPGDPSSQLEYRDSVRE